MKQWILAERPKGEVNDKTFRFEDLPIPEPSSLKDSECLVRVVDLSCDPAQRGWLDDARSYIEPVQIGAVMRASGVGIVEASKSAKLKKGDIVTGLLGWTEYAVLADKGLRKLNVPKGAQASDFLGLLGSSGQTAYWGLEDVGKIKAGDVVVVTGAAGSVGSIACQIAKLRGCKVWGIAGSDDKCEWLKSELGVDGALNYKSPTFRKDYRKLPYANVCFDNAGGEILDLMLTHLAKNARVVLCGAISAYNKPYGLKNTLTLISQRAKMEGFIVFDYARRYGEAERELGQWLAEGKMQRRETRFKGIESCVEGFQGLFAGLNTGKVIIAVSPLDRPSARL